MKLLRKKTPVIIKRTEPENPLLSKIRDLQTRCKSLEKRDQELENKLATYAQANYGLAEVVNNLAKAMQSARVTFGIPK